MMDKLTIVCNGNVEEAFDDTNGKAFDYFCDYDYECTWSYIEKDDKGLSIVRVYGFEMVDNVVKKMLDNRRTNSLMKVFKELGVNVVSVSHDVVDESEMHEMHDKLEGDEEE